MTEPKSPPLLARLGIVLWLALYVAWYWISPWLLLRQGKPDSSAWVPMFLWPTLVAGIPAGMVALWRPNKVTVIVFGVFSLIHAGIGLGLHDYYY